MTCLLLHLLRLLHHRFLKRHRRCPWGTDSRRPFFTPVAPWVKSFRESHAATCHGVPAYSAFAALRRSRSTAPASVWRTRTISSKSDGRQQKTSTCGTCPSASSHADCSRVSLPTMVKHCKPPREPSEERVKGGFLCLAPIASISPQQSSNIHAIDHRSDTSPRRGGSNGGWTDRHTTSVAFAVSVCE